MCGGIRLHLLKSPTCNRRFINRLSLVALALERVSETMHGLCTSHLANPNETQRPAAGIGRSPGLPARRVEGRDREQKHTVSRRRLSGCSGCHSILSCEPWVARRVAYVGNGIDSVIVRGESGPGARPTKPEWVGTILRPYRKAGGPSFLKEWGGPPKIATAAP